MKLAEITVEAIGPGIHTHNMPCAVCRKEPAVFISPGFYFEPCWGCQNDGWETKRKPIGGFYDWLRRKKK